MDSRTSHDGAVGYVLKVARGSTQFPTRPISCERFLIGGGSNCQLRLGGDTPMLHSIIITRNDRLWIDAVVPAPALIVNGQAVREAALGEGDSVEIGEFRFEIGLGAPVKQSQPVAEKREIDLNETLAESSAEQLVDFIDAELRQLQDVAAQQEMGARALLEAAKSVDPQADRESIHALVEQLRQRAAELEARDLELADHAERLEQTQRELQEQLEIITDELNDSDSDEPPQLRLTA